MWVDTNQNILAKEMLVCNSVKWNLLRRAWRSVGPSLRVLPGCPGKACWSGHHPDHLFRDTLTIWAGPDPWPAILSFEFFLICCHNIFSLCAGVSLGPKWQDVRHCLRYRFQDWWRWQETATSNSEFPETARRRHKWRDERLEIKGQRWRIYTSPCI